MLAHDFKRILCTFVDSESDLELRSGTLVVQLRDELIEARLIHRDMQLLVEEHGSTYSATQWLVTRVARLPLLAERLLSYVPVTEHFVSPWSNLTEQPNLEGSDVGDTVARAPDILQDVLGRTTPGTTSIVYLTSDAGEGKTTLINHLARRQAAAYKQKQSHWLLVPITLGGRGFLRFDDAVVASLVNRLRFQLLYFDAFIELVKLGAIVPAFDGFEEMFVESSSGEALSALGSLVSKLDSAGTALIAARKAYFEYQSFQSQARLFDGMGGASVGFSRLALTRWDKPQFVEYSTKRGVHSAVELYQSVSARFDATHPLLTRAVLVRRLVDVASQNDSLVGLLQKLGSNPEDYFFQFVDAIVDREANEKWIDRSGEPHVPLISTRQHHELLASVALEMWLASSDTLKAEVLDIIAEFFAEPRKLGPVLTRQVKERLKQHSLLVNQDGTRGTYAFDHEDFRQFYLGEAVGRQLLRTDTSELRRVLVVGSIPSRTVEAAVNSLLRERADFDAILARVRVLGARELPTSFIKENAGHLALALAEHSRATSVELEELVFPPDCLRGKRLAGVTFRRSHFQPTSLQACRLTNCRFEECHFERIEIPRDTQCGNVTLSNSTVASVTREAEEDQLYEPMSIRRALEEIGLRSEDSLVVPGEPTILDEDVRLVERSLRVFLRITQVNEHVFRQRLGTRANHFIGTLLPRLIEAGVFEEVPYRGSGEQTRYRMAIPLTNVHNALATCDGSFDGLLRQLRA